MTKHCIIISIQKGFVPKTVFDKQNKQVKLLVFILTEFCFIELNYSVPVSERVYI